MLKKTMYYSVRIILIYIIWVIIFHSTKPSSKSSNQILRVGTFNITYLNNYSEDFIRSLNRYDIDIALIVECSNMNINFEKLEAASYKIIVKSDTEGPNGLLLVAKDNIQITGDFVILPINGPCDSPLITARLYHNNKYYSLIGVHIPPPIPYCQNTHNPVKKELSTIFYNGRINTNIGTACMYDDLILIGDFNMLTFDKLYKTIINSGFTDSNKHHNFPPNPTWNYIHWLTPVLRIDYIFVSQSIKTFNSWTLPIKGSDHNGVITDIITN